MQPEQIRKFAGDIMIPINKYPHVSHDITIREAVVEMEHSVLMVDNQPSLPRSLLVFDQNQNLLGVVRRRDILRGLEPPFLRSMAPPNRMKLFTIDVDPNLVEFSSGKVMKAMQEQAEKPISTIMQPIAATVNHTDHLAKVIYKMYSHDLSLLPVLKNDEVIGVVRSVDVFNEIAKLLM